MRTVAAYDCFHDRCCSGLLPNQGECPPCQMVAGADDIEGHGKAMAPTGMAGELTLLQDGARNNTPLAVVGERLVTKVKLTEGAKW